MGEREIITLLTVLDVEDGPTSLANKAVADLGSGDQNLKASIESRGATYVGIYMDQCNLETDNIPLEDNSVDITIGLELIYHPYHPSQFLAEVKRILIKGGSLWIDTPDVSAFGSEFWNDPTHVHPSTRKSLRFLLEMSDFEVVRVSPNYRCKKKNFYDETNFNFF